MQYLDTKYINLISARLDKFAQKKTGLYNFRCPYCGDSQRDKKKARGYLFQMKTTYTYKCHNCGMSTSFHKFLKDFDESLHDEYVMEKYKEGHTGKGTYTPNPKFNFKKPTFKKNVLKGLTPASSLNRSHVVRKYLDGRQIPREKLSRFFYCKEFKKWTNSLQPTFDNTSHDEPRIIIPLYTKEGDVFGYQGRSLSPNSKLKYITIILDESVPKIYGLDTVDETKTIYITEGPIDSLFLENGVAMCGADVDISTFNWSDCVFVYDNEPRNREIVQRISKTIDRGDKVVIWDREVQQKDINDMVQSGLDVQSMVECSSYHGLEAKLKFTTWKKV